MIDPMAVALLHREQFTTEFMEYLPDNRHVYDAFELEANIVLGLGTCTDTDHASRRVLCVGRAGLRGLAEL